MGSRCGCEDEWFYVSRGVAFARARGKLPSHSMKKFLRECANRGNGPGQGGAGVPAASGLAVAARIPPAARAANLATRAFISFFRSQCRTPPVCLRRFLCTAPGTIAHSREPVRFTPPHQSLALGAHHLSAPTALPLLVYYPACSTTSLANLPRANVCFNCSGIASSL